VLSARLISGKSAHVPAIAPTPSLLAAYRLAIFLPDRGCMSIQPRHENKGRRPGTNHLFSPQLKTPPGGGGGGGDDASLVANRNVRFRQSSWSSATAPSFWR